MMKFSIFITIAFYVCVSASAADPISVEDVQRKDAVSFENEILPILQENCLACHSAGEKQGNLVLESPQGMLKGGDTGAAAIPGRGNESLILRLASHQDDPQMPPEGNDVAAKNLTPAELGLLRVWIDQGAKGSGGFDSLSPKQWQPLPPGVHPVQAIALTEDGQFVACSRANQIFLYHVPTGQLVTKLSDSSLDTEHTTGIAHRDLVQSLAINVDGDLVASGGFREVKLWRRPRDVQKQKLAIGAAVTAVAVSPSREWIAVAGSNHAIRLYRSDDAAAGPTINGHTDTVTSLRFTSDGNRIVSGSADQTIRFWNVADGAPQGIIEAPAAVNAIEWVNRETPTEQTPIPPQWLVTGDTEKTIRVWELPDAMPEKLPISLANITETAGSRDGSLLAMLDNKTIRVISLAAPHTELFGAELATWTVERDVTSFAFVALPDTPPNSSNHGFLTGTSDGSFQLWSLPEHAIIREWTANQPSKVTSLAVSADGSIAASGHEDGTINLWDLKTAEAEEADAIRTLEGNNKPVTAILFHSNGQTLFTTAADGSFRGYNTQNGQQTFAASHGAAIHDLAMSPNEQVLATAGENGIVRLWRTNGQGFSPQQLTGIGGPIRSVAFTSDSTKVIAASSADKSATELFDLKSATLLQRFTHEFGSAVSCLPIVETPNEIATGTIPLLAATTSGLYRLTATPIRQITGHSQPITSLVADPERVRHIFSGSLDGTARRWNLDDGRAVQQFNHGGPVTSIAISPDGQRLASASENKTAKLFRINGQQIAELRGDVRLKVGQTRAQQALSSANSRLNIAKRLLDEAEKDLPKKTEAEKKLADSLAEANKQVTEKQDAVNKAMTEKIAAEKAAIEASTAAKTALADKEHAELLARNSADATKVAQGKLTLLQRALAANPENERLKQLMATAQQTLAACQQESQELTTAVKEPTQKAQEMANSANTAAKKASDVQKPFNDATTALKTARSAQNLLSQQHVLAAKELKESQDLIPIRKEAHTRAEVAKAEAEKEVASVNELSKASEQPIRSIAFSPDGSVLATAGDFSNLHTWDGQTGQALSAFAGHDAAVRHVAFVDPDTLVSASDDQSCRFWELNPNWVLERTIGNQNDPNIIIHRVTAVDLNRDSTQLLVAGGVPSRSGELHVFNVVDGSRALYLPRAHDDVIYAARFSPDGKRVASAGADRYLRTFDVASSTQLRRFEGHTNYVLGVAWKSDGETIATSSADNTIKIWAAETGDQRRTINQQLTKHVTSVQFIGDTDNVVSSSGDRRVRIHNSNNGGLARNFSDVKSWLHCVAVTPDSKIVAAGEADGTVTIWNGTNGQLLKTLPAE